jgi:hypothetical protein
MVMLNSVSGHRAEPLLETGLEFMGHQVEKVFLGQVAHHLHRELAAGLEAARRGERRVEEQHHVAARLALGRCLRGLLVRLGRLVPAVEGIEGVHGERLAVEPQLHLLLLQIEDRLAVGVHRVEGDDLDLDVHRLAAGVHGGLSPGRHGEEQGDERKGVIQALHAG